MILTLLKSRPSQRGAAFPASCLLHKTSGFASGAFLVLLLVLGQKLLVCFMKFLEIGSF